VLILSGLSAQNSSRVEGLKKIVNRGVSDSMYIRLNIEIADEYIFNNPDTAEYYTRRALERAERLNDIAAMAKTENFLGIINYSKGHLLTSLEHYQRSQSLYKNIGDRSGSVKAANNIAIVYTNLGEYKKAISIYEEAFKTNMELNLIDDAASNIFNIAASNLALKDYESLRESIKKLEEFNRISPSSINACFMKSEIYVIEHKLDSALIELNKSYDISSAEGDEYFLASIILRRAELYLSKKEYNRALIDLGESERFISKNDFNDIKLDWLEVRSRLFEEQGMYENAYESKKEYIVLKDSLDKLNNFNRISELNAKYESEKRESEIAKQAQLIDQKTSQVRLILIIGSAIGIILGLIVYSLLKKRRLTKLLQIQNREIKIQRQKVISSINYARRIQSSILPSHDDLMKFLPESFILFKPKDIVSGDFYWYREINGKLFVAAIDCTGHGVPGAFMSLIANSQLNKVIYEHTCEDPAFILTKLHAEIIHILNQEREVHNAQDGMDISLCVIDKVQRKIEFAGANMGICMFKNNELVEFKPSPISLGGLIYERQFEINQSPFQTETISYMPGDYLFMHSDGFCDQLGGVEGKKYNKSKFRQLLSKIKENPISDASQICEDQLTAWRGSIPQTDDVLLIGARL
jgi:serine phosphatase RsbU (regulator of sigma subunit)/predicted negative regulator of RcsB-dependent stress response